MDSSGKGVPAHEHDESDSCNFCRKFFAIKDSLFEHLQMVHVKKERVLDFIECKEEIEDGFEVKEEEGLECKVEISDNYDSDFDETDDLVCEIQKSKGLECGTCQEAFTFQDELVKHCKEAHGEEIDFDCDFCCKKFGSKTSLDDHIRHNNKY